MLDDAFDEARRRGFLFIAHNIAYNDSWTRLHTMTPGVLDRLETLAAEPGPPVITNMIGIATSWGLRSRGDLAGALEAAERAHTTPAGASEKVRWRARVELAEVLLEHGRFDDAAAIVPAPSERAELQDVVYDAGVQIRLRLATERLDEAVALAREIAQHAERLAPYWDAVAIAVEAFVAAGLVDEAEAAVTTARAQQTELGLPYLDLAEGHVRLAKGDVGEARRLLEEAAAEASARGFQLYEWRARILTAEALAQLDSPEEAARELAEVIGEADSASAVLIRDAARETATRLGLAVPEPAVPLHPPMLVSPS